MGPKRLNRKREVTRIVDFGPLGSVLVRTDASCIASDAETSSDSDWKEPSNEYSRVATASGRLVFALGQE